MRTESKMLLLAAAVLAVAAAGLISDADGAAELPTGEPVKVVGMTVEGNHCTVTLDRAPTADEVQVYIRDAGNSWVAGSGTIPAEKSLDFEMQKDGAKVDLGPGAYFVIVRDGGAESSPYLFKENCQDGSVQITGIQTEEKDDGKWKMDLRLSGEPSANPIVVVIQDGDGTEVMYKKLALDKTNPGEFRFVLKQRDRQLASLSEQQYTLYVISGNEIMEQVFEPGKGIVTPELSAEIAINIRDGRAGVVLYDLKGDLSAGKFICHYSYVDDEGYQDGRSTVPVDPIQSGSIMTAEFDLRELPEHESLLMVQAEFSVPGAEPIATGCMLVMSL